MSDIDELIEKGNEFFAKGEYEKAIECYDKAIDINPNDAGALYNKGNALVELLNYKEARDLIEEALKLIDEKDDKIYALSIKGKILFKMYMASKRFEYLDKAEESIDMAIRIGGS